MTTPRIKPPKVMHYKRYIAARDGEKCFYCNTQFAKENLTVEHLLSISHGGNNHLSNLVLACQPCNLEAGTGTIIDKVEFRDRKRQEIYVRVA